MQSISLEQGLELRQISKDFYESVQLPWTWYGSKVVPGGLLMSLATAAAYETVPSDFSIDTLQANFLSTPKPDRPLQQRVQRLSDGGRFITRVVTVEQAETIMVHVTCSFVRTSAMKGPSMTHCVSRTTNRTIEVIALDDLEPGRTKLGPFMKFQHLPLVYNGTSLSLALPPKHPVRVCILTSTTQAPAPPPVIPPHHLTYTSVAQISPPITASTNPTKTARMHSLGILSLSDYHILDAPPTLHSLPFGLPAINDTTRTSQPTVFERYTSLNHSVHFHVHDGFRADELVYIEVNSPWSRGRRAEVQSRMFTGSGVLVATCKQEAYYVLKDERKGEGRDGDGAGAGKL